MVVRAGRIHARSKAKPLTLEETLEILGANDLQVETEERKSTDDPASVGQEKAKPSKLSRLFDRLAERLGT